MPNEETTAEEKLQKLGERLRRAAAKLHPVTKKEIEVAREALRQQQALEQKANADKSKEREQERDRGR